MIHEKMEFSLPGNNYILKKFIYIGPGYLCNCIENCF